MHPDSGSVTYHGELLCGLAAVLPVQQFRAHQMVEADASKHQPPADTAAHQHVPRITFADGKFRMTWSTTTRSKRSR